MYSYQRDAEKLIFEKLQDGMMQGLYILLIRIITKTTTKAKTG